MRFWEAKGMIVEAATPQKPPLSGGKDITPLVIRDLEKRASDGLKKYGVPLQAHNGRNALIDLYQELLDACCYLRQRIEEER